MDRTGAAVHLASSGCVVPQPNVPLQTVSDEGSHWPRIFRAYQAEPLVQRPAGSMGKQGVCDLAFVAQSKKTWLRHSFVSHPFHFTHPWYLDPAVPGMAVVYVQTPGGGLIQGDRTCLQCEVGSTAQVHITNQAAEKIHTMTANCALQQIVFTLGPDAYAEYCPEPLILFPGARFGQTLQIQLASGASFFGSEIFLSRGGPADSPGRAPNGVSFEALTTSLTVLDADRSVLIRDQSLALPAQHSLNGPGVLAGHHVWGQALLLGPDIPTDWARDLQAELPTESGTVWGVTLLPRERGLSVKVVGSEVCAVRHLLSAAWNLLRIRHIGVSAPNFPK